MNVTTLNMTTLDGGNVIIKKGEGGTTPTPPSGGESGDWEYYDVSASEEDMSLYAAYLSARVKKADVRDGVISKVQIGCMLFAFASSDYDKYIAFAVDFSQPCIDANGTRTLREQIALYPNTELAQLVGMLQSFPRLTKEQFYSLD